MEAYQDAEVAESEIVGQVLHQLSLVVDCQHRQLMARMIGREFHLPFLVSEVSRFHSEAENHFKDDENVLDALLAEAGVELFDCELLHRFLRENGDISEVW